MAEGKTAPKQQQQPQNQQQQLEQDEQKVAADEQQHQEAPLTGKVKWFSSEKGFGFISPDDGTADLFVHQTSVKAEGFRSLRVGEAVEYSLETGQDGRPRAGNVTGPNGANVQGEEEGGGAATGYFQGGGGGGRGFGRNTGGFGGGRGRSGGAGGGGGVCYNCNQPGHLARDCNSAAGGGGGGARRSGCYKCGEQGHFARDCSSPAAGPGGY